MKSAVRSPYPFKLVEAPSSRSIEIRVPTQPPSNSSIVSVSSRNQDRLTRSAERAA
jgi:hypothetical protein